MHLFSINICCPVWVDPFQWWCQLERIRLPMQETEETQLQFLLQEDSLEEEIATHSSIIAWKIPWTEKPSGSQSMGLQIQTQLSTYTYTLELIHFIVLSINSLISPPFFPISSNSNNVKGVLDFVCKNRICSHMNKLSF